MIYDISFSDNFVSEKQGAAVVEVLEYDRISKSSTLCEFEQPYW